MERVGRSGAATGVLAAGIVAVVALASSAAHAVGDLAEGRLAEPALSSVFSGATFEGAYQSGIGWREVYGADGRVAYSDDRGPARGDWFVRDDLLCTFYDAGLQGGCFVVIVRSENCFDFYAVDLATNAPDAGWPAIRQGEGWTARGGRADVLRTCPEDLVS